WCIIRYPHGRRARRTPKVRRSDRGREIVLMAISAAGLGVLPSIYVIANAPAFANYALQPWQPWLGAAVFAAALWLFRRTHKDLRRHWSVTLEMRDRPTLVTNGVSSGGRRLMFLALWLWAVAGFWLLPIWLAGRAGLFGFGRFFFLRGGGGEALMTKPFGDEYRRYMARTSRILPGIY